MEIPKVLWLKKHMPSPQFSDCMFFDLPDYLTYRATDNLARSNCSLVCKCSYVPPGVDGSELGWQPDFFEKIGLGELAKDDFKQLGGIPGRNGIVLTAGQPVGEGLSERAAKEFGLEPGTPVGSALIDAYAGWVGTVAAPATNKPGAGKPDLLSSQHRLAAIAGTSTCHVVQSPDGILVNGVWGPYKHAVFPGMWMNEGGQSSTGQVSCSVASLPEELTANAYTLITPPTSAHRLHHRHAPCVRPRQEDGQRARQEPFRSSPRNPRRPQIEAKRSLPLPPHARLFRLPRLPR